MRINPVVAMVATALACGGKSSTAPALQTQGFTLVLPERISVRRSETAVIVLVAIGASGQISYQVQGLPPFPSVDGNTIRVTPGPTDPSGDTTVTVTATDGEQADSGSFILTVDGATGIGVDPTNRPPGFADIMELKGTLDSSYPTTAQMIGGSSLIRVRGDAFLWCGFRDLDGDKVQMLAEVRPLGEALTGSPNYQSELAANPGNNHSFIAPDGLITLDLPGVEVGKHYQVSVWMRDIHGAESAHFAQKDFIRVE